MMPPISTVAVTILPDGRLDRKNAARYCGLSEKTLAMHACRGTGPHFVKRGKVFYFIEALDRWIKEGEQGGNAAENERSSARCSIPNGSDRKS
jgi:hypothetical protein